MKFASNVLLLIAMTASVFANADVTFKVPKVSRIVVKIVRGGSCSGSECSILDEKGQTRLTYWPNIDTFTYHSANGQQQAELILTEDERSQLKLLIRNASAQCPVTITLDRDTFQPKEISTPCDPMAAIESEKAYL